MQMSASTGSGHGEQLQAITDAALAHHEIDVLLRTLVARICEILGVDSCTIVVHTADHDRVVFTGPQNDTVSTYVVPLEVSGVLLGELRVAALAAHTFDAELLQLVADRAAMAIDHAQLFESER